MMMGDGYSSVYVSQIICKDLHLKCFKRCHAQELTDVSCTARLKRAKLLLHNIPQRATDFVFFTDEKVFLVTSPDSRQNKVSGRLQELLKKKLTASFSVRALRSLPLRGRLLNVPVFCSFLNGLLTPRFVHLFSGISSVNLFAVYPSKYKLFIKILSSLLNIMLIVDKHCSNVCGDKFPMPQIDHRSK